MLTAWHAYSELTIRSTVLIPKASQSSETPIMASLATRTFIVTSPENGRIPHRTARRVVLNADVVKTAKLTTGDVVAIYGAQAGLPPVNLDRLTESTAL